MKTFFLIIGMCVIQILSIQYTFGQTPKEENVIEQMVRKALDSNRYTIHVNYAYPMRGSSIALTSDYSLQIRNDSAFSHLPYFGRAYNIPYGGGDGLNFNEPLSNYTAEYHKKGKVKIKFRVVGKEDTYNFFITIFRNGTVDMNVSSVNRQPISFSGNIQLPEISN